MKDIMYFNLVIPYYELYIISNSMISNFVIPFVLQKLKEEKT